MYIHVLYLVVLLLVLCIAAQAIFSSLPSQALNWPFWVFPWFSPYKGEKPRTVSGATRPQSSSSSQADVAKMVGNIRFLTLVKPVLHVLPEVAQPDRKIPFKARLPA